MSYEVKWDETMDLWRIYDTETEEVAMSRRHGHPIDGGGHVEEEDAYRQLGHLQE